jgi:hypothetical protein
MKKDKSILRVFIASLYLLVYIVFLSLESTTRIAFFMFSVSPVMLIWLVVGILKHGKPGKRTFDSYYYEDVDF